MKNTLLTTTLTLLSIITFGQVEKASSKSAADSFEKNFNAGDFDAIFSLFTTEMKNTLPADETKTFFTALKAQTGQIIKRTFIKYQNGTNALYKTNFEKAVFEINISVDDNSRINGLLFKPYKDVTLPQMERNATKMQLPFKGEWTVLWGGDTREQNYHVAYAAQKNAFDLVITGKAGKSYKTNGSTNDDYYAFGRELLAPCDGEVVMVVDGVKDNIPGTMDPTYLPGNTVIIRTAKNEYLFFAHFKQHSIKVHQGQRIRQGQLLGLCGNSGNSSEPHLHFHIQNSEDMNTATGVKCYFDLIMVNGQAKADYSPVKNDKIRNGSE